MESFNRVLSLVFSYPTVHTQQSSVPNGVAEHNVTMARTFGTTTRARTPCPPTWCRRKVPGVSAFLKSKITATTMKTRTFIGPDFFSADKLRNEACTRAGRSAKGGKFMSIRGLPSGRVEVLWEPGNFQDDGAKRVGVCFASNTNLELWTEEVEQGVIDNGLPRQTLPNSGLYLGGLTC